MMLLEGSIGEKDFKAVCDKPWFVTVQALIEIIMWESSGSFFILLQWLKWTKNVIVMAGAISF